MNYSTYRVIGLLAAAFIFCTADYAAADNLLPNGDFSKTHVDDNLWDGINKKGELQLDPSSPWILVSGSSGGWKAMGISPVFKDVTGDGKPELIACSSRGFIWIYELASKKNAFPLKFKPARFLHSYYDSCISLDIIDMNADRLMDLIYGEGSYSANSVYLYLNQGNNSNPSYDSARRHWLAYGMGREQLAPAIGDLDADGDPDLLVGDRIGNVTWYENTGPTGNADTPYLSTIKATVSVGGSIAPAGQCVRPYLADVDGDKDLDLFLGCEDGRIVLSRNIGVPSDPDFAKPEPLTGPDTAKPVTVADSWSIQYGGGNSAAQYEIKSENDLVTGQKITFAHLDYFDGYVGVNVGFNRIHRDTPDWQTFRFTFSFPRLTKEADKKDSTGAGIGFGPDASRPDSYFDVSDIQIHAVE